MVHNSQLFRYAQSRETPFLVNLLHETQRVSGAQKLLILHRP